MVAWYQKGIQVERLKKLITSDEALPSQEEGLRCVVYSRTSTEQLQTIEQGSKTLICISFTKLNIHLLLERVFPNFIWMFIDCYSTASKCYKETAQIP
ncbi:hypothetical protein CSKR_113981 [Clonorchis sinensis]|uniref:Uncharacterized protein n=1 Tax=Clonorchis sinensis TaxID=79923 RepID=A0A419PT16_CLOSI|nr:hypothetical protein CSKR_113981 [Clonorchis sinensis]